MKSFKMVPSEAYKMENGWNLYRNKVEMTLWKMILESENEVDNFLWAKCIEMKISYIHKKIFIFKNTYILLHFLALEIEYVYILQLLRIWNGSLFKIWCNIIFGFMKNPQNTRKFKCVSFCDSMNKPLIYEFMLFTFSYTKRKYYKIQNTRSRFFFRKKAFISNYVYLSQRKLKNALI